MNVRLMQRNFFFFFTAPRERKQN